MVSKRVKKSKVPLTAIFSFSWRIIYYWSQLQWGKVNREDATKYRKILTGQAIWLCKPESIQDNKIHRNDFNSALSEILMQGWEVLLWLDNGPLLIWKHCKVNFKFIFTKAHISFESLSSWATSSDLVQMSSFWFSSDVNILI